MPKKKNIDKEADEKEYSRLWYEYLKRSGEYKKFCEHMRARVIPDDWILPERDIDLFLPRWLKFGDVHKNSFASWWRKRENLLRISKGRSVVQSLDGLLEKEFDNTIQILARFYKREPSLLEVKKFFFKKISTPGKSNFRITLEEGISNKSIFKRLGEFLNKARWGNPKRKIRLKQLDQYLKIFDLHYPQQGKDKKLTIKEIAHKYYKGRVADGAENAVYNPGRIVSEMIGKAKRIIHNAERGNFPGEY